MSIPKGTLGTEQVRSRRQRVWVAVITLALSAATLLTIATVAGSAIGAQLVGAALAVGWLMIAVAAFLLVRRMVDLQEDRRRTTDLSRELVSTKALLDHTQQVQRERLHDARSTIFGVLGASAVLTRSAVEDMTERDSLHRLITAELTRLQSLLDIDSVEPAVDYDIAYALAPVIQAHSLTCRTLSSDLRSLSVTGRPQQIATALDNVIHNARQHAPGASITVACHVHDGYAEIIVDDDGPGIAPGDRDDVLRPGVRGPSARGAGHGLGLHNAATAVREQGGRLDLAASASGGLRVTFLLPLAAPTLTLLAS